MSAAKWTDSRVLATMRREKDTPLKPYEIAAWSGIDAATVRRSLDRLAVKGRVSKNPVGYWELTDPTPTTDVSESGAEAAPPAPTPPTPQQRQTGV